MKSKIKKKLDEDEREDVIDENDKKFLDENMPFFYKYFDFDIGQNYKYLISWRVF